MATAESFNRSSALKQFDETKAGVRGLIESGINTLPAIFRLPAPLSFAAPVAAALSIPTIDLSLPSAGALVCAAARDWGFFQITNHGIPLSAIAATFSAGRSFHELPAEDRSHYYTRGPAGGVSYISNIDLFRSKTASWRDTLQISMGPNPAEPDRIPAICRAELLAWDEHVVAIGRRLLGMLSEGMGVDQQRLEELTCLEGRAMVCHYYPPSPEPDLTVGLADHSDPGVLTVLVQDQIGGLQVKRTAEDGEISWVDAKPVEGAIVINVGDLLQIISNNKYKSVHHRVVANSCEEPRISIATFFNPGKRGESVLYGPLPELVSPGKPAHYRNFTMAEFLGTFFSKELATESLLDHFKIVGETTETS